MAMSERPSYQALIVVAAESVRQDVCKRGDGGRVGAMGRCRRLTRNRTSRASGASPPNRGGPAPNAVKDKYDLGSELRYFLLRRDSEKIR